MTDHAKSSRQSFRRPPGASAAPGETGFKRLLIGTDFSPRADAALRRALQIASAHGATLTLFHAYNAGARADRQTRKGMAGAEETARRKLRSLPRPMGLPQPFASRQASPSWNSSAQRGRKTATWWWSARTAGIS